MRFRFQIVFTLLFDEHGNVFSYKLEKGKSKLLEKCT